MQISSAVEDYLRTIYKMGSQGDRVTPTALALTRDVSGPSVSVMVRRLVEADLVERGPGAEVLLTAAGKRAALRVVRRHRLLETFLVEVCGLAWDEVDIEAEALEHVLSPRLEARIDEMLGHPTHDPHGDPIPSPLAELLDDGWDDPLDQAIEGTYFTVTRVNDRDPQALRHLAAVGVRPGVVLAVGARSPFGGPLAVYVDEAPESVALPPGLTVLVHGRSNRPTGRPDLRNGGRP